MRTDGELNGTIGRDGIRARHPSLLKAPRLSVGHIERCDLAFQQQPVMAGALQPVANVHARGVWQHRLRRAFDNKTDLPAHPFRFIALPCADHPEDPKMPSGQSGQWGLTAQAASWALCEPLAAGSGELGTVCEPALASWS